MTNNNQNLLPNCGVVAVANATGATVTEMMDSFRECLGFSKRWQGRATVAQLSRMLKLWDKPNRVKRINGYSLERWTEWETVPGRAYIVRTGNHFQYVKDGVVSDQHMTAPASEFHWKRKYVTHVIEIKGAA